jgi:hypothetical protein
MDEAQNVDVTLASLDQVLKERRTQLKLIAVMVRTDMTHREVSHPEILENLTLAYRHLEDASMRLGKAIQAYDGGKSAAEDAVSIYDK